jgi:hypothetical protein
MANIDAPFGFRPSGKVGGNPDNGALSQYTILDADNTTMFQGDLVKLASGGVTDAAVADAGLMVFNGIQFDDPTTGKPTFKNQYGGNTTADADIDCFVYDDPYQVYEAQGDSETAASQAMVGTYMDHLETHSGNTTTGISGDEIDVSDTSTTLSGVKFLGLAKTPGNSFGVHNVLRCFIAESVHVN